MTHQERQIELEALDRDEENLAVIISAMDTSRLKIVAEAIKMELLERYVGKPWDIFKLH